MKSGQKSKHQQELNSYLNKPRCMRYIPADDEEPLAYSFTPAQQGRDRDDITERMKRLTRPSQHDEGAAGSSGAERMS